MTVTKFKAYAGKGKDKPLELFEYEPRPLGDHDVEIDIQHCGICASDIHTLDSGWGPTDYPCVVGHEIVGTVSAAGKNAHLKVGQKVGVGAQVLSCMQCDLCNNRSDQLCKERVFTYNGKYKDGQKSYGGYANKVRVHEEFAFEIPEGMPLDVAAPLFCAGTTVFNPLKRFGCGAGKRVGVNGIGGLGHLAVQFAAKMGAEVCAISHSNNKKDESQKLGAKLFLSVSDEESFKKATGTLDLLLITSNHKGQPWAKYLSLLKPHGHMILLAVPEEPLTFSPGDLVMREVNMSGSLIGSRALIKEMLQFAQEHKVYPWIEKMPISKVNEAIERVRNGQVRYRLVLENKFNL